MPEITDTDRQIRRLENIFGDRSLPCSSSGFFGPTKEEQERFFKHMIVPLIVFGEWTREEMIFLLENRKNAINPEGNSHTSVVCPNSRKEELIQILKDKFGDNMVSKMSTVNGKVKAYISVDNGRHILILKDEGGPFDGSDAHFVMHYK